MENQVIHFSSGLIANVEERLISGKIVPAGTGEVGNTSAGKVVFEKGAIALPEDPKTVKLLNQHDSRQPLGKATQFTEQEDGIYASFKVSRSNRGSEALILAEEGLQSGLSVGVEVIKSKQKGNVMFVSAAKLLEVSLVTEPAFKSAQVIDVAAEETPEVVEEEITPTESETAVENTPETVAAPAVEDSTSTNTGLTLAPHLNTFLTDTFTGRPAFEAVTRSALLPEGMSFTVPRLYVNNATANTAPTVADTNEGSAPSETGMTSAYDTVTVEKFSGLNRVSFELIDRSQPAFMELLMTELRKAYEKATDNAMIAAWTANGTQATGVAATAAGLQSFISTEAAAAYKGTGGDYANKLVASTDQWASIMSYVDGASRPLYAVASPQFNASGQAIPTSVRGNVLGTDLIVDHNISVSGIVDESAFLVAPNSVYAWESPTTQLRVNVLTSGEVEINLYGYLAIYVAKSGKGVRRFNYTAP